jgi:hypothetical protein
MEGRPWRCVSSGNNNDQALQAAPDRLKHVEPDRVAYALHDTCCNDAEHGEDDTLPPIPRLCPWSTFGGTAAH